MTEIPQDFFKWDVKQRLTLLEATVYWTGELITNFLTDTFSISRVQATKDIALYLSFRPDNLRYDRSLKRYLITEQFTPLLITGSPQECLQVLQASKSAASPVVTLMSNLPTIEVLPSPTRRIDVAVLRPVLQAARFGLVLEIGYQSMTTSEPAVRKVQPHTLVFDGWRWHMRAFSYSHNEFRDFVLARIHKAMVVGKLEKPNPVDTLWETQLTVEIGPHPGLSDSQKLAIERDFGMLEGKSTITVRAALLSYLLLSLRIGKDDYQREAMAQQTVLLNREELLFYIAF
ncbi:WYL domain-containing protein [Methylicorpusculum sp.]|uniref:WYL domain-containing protein n=1 Tax=Methylicorpusculum sp. TaxID=2713644 RepID=UPI00271DAA0F|nr:WYL domain-containing protein [Methylicorpusculum sp.]MDO8844473.1 WYL domain-containing protein [Methylicorpusculum sp.]MDP2179082.1 WYL domain-containing protein [Methylicorpusculum sp.]MDP3529453.1 WYL domain-containing protein [Methylicorpusculum sp.]MDZ4151722.1 WYL domain-containing protein [Methylicorpusculum sp.]